MIHPHTLVDRLGLLQARAADLETEIADVKAQLVAAGEGEHVGQMFRAIVSKFARETIAPATMRAKLEALGVTRRWFTDHTDTRTITTVRVTARSAAAEKQAA